MWQTMRKRVLAAARTRVWPAQAVWWMVGLWVATVGNVPVWQAVLAADVPMAAVALGALLVLVWGALMQLLAWRWTFKPLVVMAVLVCAFNTHFMRTYGVVIDPSMMANALATDAREVRDLLSWSLVGSVLLVAGPALWLVWRVPVRYPQGWRGVAQRVSLMAAAVLGSAVVLWLSYADVASLMRNHKPVRYQINPFNTVYGLARLATQQAPGVAQALEPVGTDAKVVRAPGDKPPLLVLVVGETARAANFGLSGYERPTTPALQRWMQQGQMVYWQQASSCGTNTHVSVPCMFSPLTGAQGGDERPRHENLLDVLQRAGLAVLWLDNQSGCKGVCDRVPNTHVTQDADPRWCQDGECLDEALLQGLDERLQALDPARRAQGVVLVLHQMGSHGPAYFKRTPADRKPFMPECTNVTLAECPPDQLRNAYDNTIAYTDHVLDQALLWLQARERDGQYATGLVYASDHGESLGEKGLYLHGAPRAFAPSEQIHVPMLAWYSPTLAKQLRLDVGCLRQRAQEPVSHDHLFHTTLGVMGVQTQAHRPDLDWQTPCMAR